MSTASPPYPGAIPPPAGVVPKLSNPDDSLRTTYVACIAVISAPPLILIPLRLYVRKFLIEKFSKVEWVLTVVWFLFIGLTFIALFLANYGLGIHGWDLPTSTFSGFEEVVNIDQIIYMPNIALAKTALLLQLEEVFVSVRFNKRWWILYTLIVLDVVFFTASLLLEVFQCIPREAIWDQSVQGRCLNIEQTYIATASVNVFLDFTIFSLPLYWISKLTTYRSKKLKIAAVFATALFACIASIMRLAESILHLDTDDVTYQLVPIAIWAQAEVSLSIIVCCLPVLPRLFYKKKETSSAGSSKTFTNNQYYLPSQRKDYYQMKDNTGRRDGDVSVPVSAHMPEPGNEARAFAVNPNSSSNGTSPTRLIPEYPGMIMKSVSVRQTSENILSSSATDDTLH